MKVNCMPCAQQYFGAILLRSVTSSLHFSKVIYLVIMIIQSEHLKHEHVFIHHNTVSAYVALTISHNRVVASFIKSFYHFLEVMIKCN